MTVRAWQPRSLVNEQLIAMPGWTKIASGTANSSASISFTNLVGYTAYKFVLGNIRPTTDNVQLSMRASTNNGSTFDSGANYRWALTYGLSTGTGGAAGSTSDTGYFVGSIISNNSVTGVTGQLELVPSSTVQQQLTGTVWAWQSSGQYFAQAVGGVWITTGTMINAVQFIFSSGTIAGGTITAYGLAA